MTSQYDEFHIPQFYGTNKTLVPIVLILSVLIPYTVIPIARIEAETDASFESIRVSYGTGDKDVIDGGVGKLYPDQDPAYINLTFHNFRCAMGSGSHFQIQVISTPTGGAGDSGNLTVNEGYDGEAIFNLCYLKCSICPGATSIWDLERNDSEPFTFILRLYYYINANRTLEDEKTISLEVANDFIDVSPVSFSAWINDNNRIDLNVSNLDSDTIRNVSITILNSGPLVVSPLNVLIGSISAGGYKAQSVDISVPENVSVGTSNITVRVDCVDFSGVSHVEDTTIAVSLQLKRDLTYLYYAIGIAAIVVTCGLALIVRRRQSRPAKTH